MRDELAIAMRSTINIVSVPHGPHGCKVVITMDEETHLYEMLASAWDRAMAASSPIAAGEGEK